MKKIVNKCQCEYVTVIIKKKQLKWKYKLKFKKGKIKEENALGRVGKDWSKRAGAEGICSAGGVGSQRKRGGVN